jgi:hypothetical protein
MYDKSLGGDVDAEQYDGPFIDGKPLHAGNCRDGVHGCSRCRNAVFGLSDDQKSKLGDGWAEDCDWCHKTFAPGVCAETRSSDEIGVFYILCPECRAANTPSSEDYGPLSDDDDDDFDHPSCEDTSDWEDQ